MDGMNGHMDDDMEHMDYGDESGQMVSQLQQIISISNPCTQSLSQVLIYLLTLVLSISLRRVTVVSHGKVGLRAVSHGKVGLPAVSHGKVGLPAVSHG